MRALLAVSVVNERRWVPVTLMAVAFAGCLPTTARQSRSPGREDVAGADEITLRDGTDLRVVGEADLGPAGQIAVYTRQGRREFNLSDVETTTTISYGRGFVNGFFGGVFTGFFGGVILGALTYDDDDGDFLISSRGDNAFFMGMGFGMLGGLIGSVYGLARGSRQIVDGSGIDVSATRGGASLGWKGRF